MARITAPDDVKALGTIVSIWAHPDDETFSCAGLMNAAVNNGQRVVCITATKGEEGQRDWHDWPPEKLGGIRAAELQQVLDILKVKEHHWLGYRDGHCAEADPHEATDKLATIMQEIAPDTILTFGPDGLTGHPDHQTVSNWAREAAARLDKRPTVYFAVELKANYDRYLRQADDKFNIYYNIDKPPLCEAGECDICFCLTPEHLKLKRLAVEAMPSQTKDMMTYFDKKLFAAAFKCECFVLASTEK